MSPYLMVTINKLMLPHGNIHYYLYHSGGERERERTFRRHAREQFFTSVRHRDLIIFRLYCINMLANITYNSRVFVVNNMMYVKCYIAYILYFY